MIEQLVLPKGLQAKHITDEQILSLLTVKRWTQIWTICDALPDFPGKVVQAKLRQLKKRGLVHGCDCGCRGDWHLPCDGYYGKGCD